MRERGERSEGAEVKGGETRERSCMTERSCASAREKKDVNKDAG